MINAPRQSGKTTKIINEMKRNKSALMITHCKMEAMRIMKNNPELIDRVMILGEYNKRDGLKSYDEVHIDDLELILKVGHRIGMITMTNYPGGSLW